MKRLLTATILFLIAGVPLQLAAQACHPADREQSIFVNWVSRAVSSDSTDPDANERRAFLHLPYAAASRVILVTDSLTCMRALEALREVVPRAPINSPIVVRLGDRFIASDPGWRVGEWRQGVVFTSDWIRVAGFGF